MGLSEENISKLMKCGYFFLSPGSGQLPRRTLSDQGDILEEILVLLTRGEAAGERIVSRPLPGNPSILYGSFSNYFSGKMGYALATIARRRGADVTLISGPSSAAYQAT